MYYGYNLEIKITACILVVQEDNHNCKQIKQFGNVSCLVRGNQSRDMLLLQYISKLKSSKLLHIKRNADKWRSLQGDWRQPLLQEFLIKKLITHCKLYQQKTEGYVHT